MINFMGLQVGTKYAEEGVKNEQSNNKQYVKVICENYQIKEDNPVPRPKREGPPILTPSKRKHKTRLEDAKVR